MAERWGGMQGMQVAAEPLSAPPYATECAMTLDGTTALHNGSYVCTALISKKRESSCPHIVGIWKFLINPQIFSYMKTQTPQAFLTRHHLQNQTLAAFIFKTLTKLRLKNLDQS